MGHLHPLDWLPVAEDDGVVPAAGQADVGFLGLATATIILNSVERYKYHTLYMAQNLPRGRSTTNVADEHTW